MPKSRGLPPTPAEVDAFLADKNPRAYEKLIDRLLESPHYGERMAVEWLDALGLERVRAHELALVEQALTQLAEVPGLAIHGPLNGAERGALVSFTLEGAHPHDIGEILGSTGVCVRAGHHCAQPLMRRLGATATTRASFAVHSSPRDTERLLDGLSEVRRILRLG